MAVRSALHLFLVAVGACASGGACHAKTDDDLFPPVPELPPSSSLPPARYLQDASPVVIRQMCGLRRQRSHDCGLARLQLQDLVEAAAGDLGEVVLGDVVLSNASNICYYDFDKPMARARGFERPASLTHARNWTLRQFWDHRQQDHGDGSTAFAYYSDRADSMLAMTVRRLVDI